eukprot:1188458-Prorocentrum_minimum.AAC.5
MRHVLHLRFVICKGDLHTATRATRSSRLTGWHQRNVKGITDVTARHCSSLLASLLASLLVTVSAAVREDEGYLAIARLKISQTSFALLR